MARSELTDKPEKLKRQIASISKEPGSLTVMSDIMDKGIKALTGFGLTTLQSRVYWTLAKSNKSSVKDISRDSKIARQDVYRVASELYGLGLVEKLVTTPTQFKAIPVSQAFSLLIERRNQETVELQQKAIELLKNYRGLSFEQTIEKEEDQFVVIRKPEAQSTRIKQALGDAQSCIRLVTNWAFLRQFLLALVSDKNKTLPHNVVFRAILEEPVGAEPSTTYLNDVLKKSHFKIKHISKPTASTLVLFDTREVAISLSAAGISETPFLWSTNSQVLELTFSFFERMWDSAS